MQAPIQTCAACDTPLNDNHERCEDCGACGPVDKVVCLDDCRCDPCVESRAELRMDCY